ncbi:MAG: dTDP-4-dehydrorhamnose 3,5-epimerase family protein [Bacteroidetes bacterium]|nr:dTDP-4-dehydrorhamnose 3,5-epimerase family protein [Bacteroidota bacterium]
MFKKGPIDGVITENLRKFVDERGWLCELFRHDNLDEKHYPVMAYTSLTQPDTARGPHEHADQTDLFCFIGPSNFKLYLWDHRKNSPTFGNRMVLFTGEDSPMSVIIPPGVVHAYKNVGGKPGIVLNCANRLYAGKNKKEPVDEIRHEDTPDSPFRLD